ncbi:MAG TPA: HIT family protein [Acidobacteriota bacterium]
MSKQDSLKFTSTSCSFCQIVSGEKGSCVVFEDATSFGFLDHRPVFPGHCLLLPKDHYETLADLPDTLISDLFRNVQLLARAVELGLQADGSFVAVNNRVSQSVPHMHVHVVPRRKKDGLKGFFWPRNPYKDQAAMAEIQAQLRSAIAKIQSEAVPSGG